MKKFLAIIAIATFAVACNNSGEKKATTDTTAAPKMDTVAAPVAPVMDTTAKVDTTAPKM